MNKLQGFADTEQRRGQVVRKRKRNGGYHLNRNDSPESDEVFGAPVKSTDGKSIYLAQRRNASPVTFNNRETFASRNINTKQTKQEVHLTDTTKTILESIAFYAMIAALIFIVG